MAKRKYSKTAEGVAMAVDLLRKEPKYRFRKNNNRATAVLLKRKYPQYFKDIDKQTLAMKRADFVDLLKHSKTFSRGIRKAKELFPHLDGDKRNDSKIYTTQSMMLELGYEPDYYQDIKPYLSDT